MSEMLDSKFLRRFAQRLIPGPAGILQEGPGTTTTKTTAKPEATIVGPAPDLELETTTAGTEGALEDEFHGVETGPSIGESETQFVEAALKRIAMETGDQVKALRHAYRRAVELPPVHQRAASNATGFLAEELAREKLAQFFPGSVITHGVQLHEQVDGRSVGEFDAVLQNKEGEVIALAESKVNASSIKGGLAKLRSHLEGIQDGRISAYRMPDSHGPTLFDEEGPYPRSAFLDLDRDACIGVTARGGHIDDDGTVVCLDITYESIQRIASIITYYTGAKKPFPELDDSEDA